MKLRRWCVSQVSEPLALYWTLRSAEKDYWARMKFQGAAERVGFRYRNEWFRLTDEIRVRIKELILEHGGELYE